MGLYNKIGTTPTQIPSSIYAFVEFWYHNKVLWRNELLMNNAIMINNQNIQSSSSHQRPLKNCCLLLMSRRILTRKLLLEYVPSYFLFPWLETDIHLRIHSCTNYIVRVNQEPTVSKLKELNLTFWWFLTWQRSAAFVALKWETGISDFMDKYIC